MCIVTQMEDEWMDGWMERFLFIPNRFWSLYFQYSKILSARFVFSFSCRREGMGIIIILPSFFFFDCVLGCFADWGLGGWVGKNMRMGVYFTGRVIGGGREYYLW